MKIHENPSSGGQVVPHARTGMTKPTLAFRNPVKNAPPPPPTKPVHINEESKLRIIFWTPYYHLKPGCCGLQLFDWYYRVFSFYQITKPVYTGTLSYRRKWSITNTPDWHLLSNVDCHVVSQSSQFQSFLACETNQLTDAQWILHASAALNTDKNSTLPTVRIS